MASTALTNGAWMLGSGPGWLLSARLLWLLPQLVPHLLQGHFPHEERDGKITLVPVSTEKERCSSQLRDSSSL